MIDRSARPDRLPGRPRGVRRAAIPDNLIRALHEVLAEKPADAVTLREIAARAGTSPEMVRYYFNGKGGLINALLDSSLARVRDRLGEMTRQVEAAEHGHSRLIIDCLASIYLDESAASKLFNIEFARTRRIGRAADRGDRSGAIVEVVHAVICRLIERGVYRTSLDPELIAVMMMSLTGYPVRLLETLSPRWVSDEKLRDPRWREEMATLVDRYCLA